MTTRLRDLLTVYVLRCQILHKLHAISGANTTFWSKNDESFDTEFDKKVHIQIFFLLLDVMTLYKTTAYFSLWTNEFPSKKIKYTFPYSI
jgi:hypothetical protein